MLQFQLVHSNPFAIFVTAKSCQVNWLLVALVSKLRIHPTSFGLNVLLKIVKLLGQFRSLSGKKLDLRIQRCNRFVASTVHIGEPSTFKMKLRQTRILLPNLLLDRLTTLQIWLQVTYNSVVTNCFFLENATSEL